MVPYTDELEANTNRSTACSLAASSRLKVPWMFVSIYKRGSCIDGRTPARAARWNTVSNLPSAKTRSTVATSRISASTRFTLPADASKFNRFSLG